MSTPTELALAIGLTGYTCSGKSEFAKLLERKGFSRVSLGDLTREVARERGLTVARTETWELFKTLTAEDPRWRLARTLRAIEGLHAPKVVLDGIRIKEEAQGLAQALGETFLLLEVCVNEELRLQRAVSRQRDVDPTRWDAAAQARWRQMDGEEVAMIDRLRPMVEATVRGGD
ncbi:MAG: AAA family ATPase [Thermoplasmata archaeon]|nr:AAA family ATPase [Thermoplasmata archaeon]